MTSPSTQLVTIEKPVYGGSFLARAQGKAIFVPLMLPGEEARIRITQDKRSFALADAEEVTAPSSQRVAPACPHFGACGGCDYQHAGYLTQLVWKQAILRETLERAGVPAPLEIAVLSGEPWRYRNRIRLAVDAQGRLGYRGRRTHDVVPVEQCPVAAPVLTRAAKAFQEVLLRRGSELHATELTLFCNRQETSLLASLLTTRLAKPQLENLARGLTQSIPELQGIELAVEGRNHQAPRGIAHWGKDCLHYDAAGVDYRVDQGAFFQVNRWLVEDLIRCVTQNASGRLAWDLFAGVGLFARQLVKRFERVVAVESAPASIQALRANLDGTQGEAVQADTLSFLRSHAREARPDCIVVDPPRTGLGAEITAWLRSIAAPALVYVSCDPATLARDLRSLLGSGYEIDSLTLVDLFPQTFHMETVVHLRRS